MAVLTIIDDDEDFAHAVATVLENSGHDVKVELSIKSAKRNLAVRFPDLIILDVMFPEDSSAGFEMARALRHFDEEFKEIPIIMLSAVNSKLPYGFSTRDIDNYWLPVDDFLEKPVDFNVLQKKVAELLKKKNHNRNYN